jgi:dihydroorotase
LESAIEKLTTAPAKAFSLRTGTLAPGVDADVVIVDPQETWEIDPSRFRSKSRNTPFAGWKVKGRVKTTLLGGKIVYDLEAVNR